MEMPLLKDFLGLENLEVKASRAHQETYIDGTRAVFKIKVPGLQSYTAFDAETSHQYSLLISWTANSLNKTSCTRYKLSSGWQLEKFSKSKGVKSGNRQRQVQRQIFKNSKNSTSILQFHYNSAMQVAKSYAFPLAFIPCSSEEG